LSDFDLPQSGIEKADMKTLHSWCFSAALGLLGLTAGGLHGAVIGSDVTSPFDPVTPVAATPGSGTSAASTVAGGFPSPNSFPLNEDASQAIDTTLFTQYRNYSTTDAGLIVTLATNGPKANLFGILFGTGSGSNTRDPTTVSIEGTNGSNPVNGTVVWSPIYLGPTGLATDPGRNKYGPYTPFIPTTVGAFSSYRILVEGVRGPTADSFQIGDVQLIGATFVPEPASLGLLGVGAVGLLARRRRA
jgi:hypothetical protein